MKIFRASGKYIVVVLLSLFAIFPFFWMISCALRKPSELITLPPRMLPQFPTFENFSYVLTKTDMPVYFWNTIIVAGVATFMCLLVAVPAGYSIARHNYRGKNIVIVLILASNMVPQASTLVPIYNALNTLNLIDNKFSLSYTHLLCMLPFAIMMISGFIKTIPKELEEAAMMDGCSKIGLIRRVIIPVATPGIFATSMYAFMISWEEFLYSLTFTTGKAARTISVGIDLFAAEYRVDWSSILSSAVLMSLPILILFLLIQDIFIKSAVGGAIKE